MSPKTPSLQMLPLFGDVTVEPAVQSPSLQQATKSSTMTL